jgi:hypothetical protein
MIGIRDRSWSRLRSVALHRRLSVTSTRSIARMPLDRQHIAATGTWVSGQHCSFPRMKPDTAGIVSNTAADSCAARLRSLGPGVTTYFAWRP